MSKKTLEQLNSELDANIPRSAVKQREGAGRRSFSYLSTDYVIDRANKVFGNLNWGSETIKNECVFQGQVNGKHCVSFIAIVRVEFQHMDESGRVHRTSHTGTGYGDGTDASNLGKAFELAAKEAESDALKRALKNAGQSMGLALYDKDQTNVEDDAPAGKAPAAAGPQTANAPAAAKSPTSATSKTNVSERPKAQAPHADRPSAAGAHGAERAAATAAHADREQVNRKITALSKIVVSQGKATTDELKAELKQKYGVDTKEQLTDAQAQELLDKLNKLAG